MLALIRSHPIALHVDIGDSVEFLDRMCARPRAAWLALGEAEQVRGAEPGLPDAAAQAALDRAIAERKLNVAAWYVRDAVLTSAQLACGVTTEPPRVARRLDAARRVVERAALAHLVRRWLTARDFAQLVAPFADTQPTA